MGKLRSSFIILTFMLAVMSSCSRFVSHPQRHARRCEQHEVCRGRCGAATHCVCRLAGLLGRHNSLTSLEIIEGDVLSAMLRLIASTKHKSQLAGLQAPAQACCRMLCQSRMRAASDSDAAMAPHARSQGRPSGDYMRPR